MGAVDWFLPGTVDSKINPPEKYTKMSERIKKAAKLKSSSATEIQEKQSHFKSMTRSLPEEIGSGEILRSVCER